MWLLVIPSDLSSGLRVDLATPNSYTWRGVRCLKLDHAFRRKVWEGGTYRLHAHDILYMQFCRDIMGSLELREKYRSGIKRIYLDNPHAFEARLTEIFGPHISTQLSEVCRKANFEGLRNLGKQMRRAVIWRGLVQDPIGTSRDILRYLVRRCGEYIRPNGVMVAVIGPDGSGKGTLIEKLELFMTGPLQFPPRVYHWRPGLLPSLGSLFLGRNDGDTPVSDPHAKEPSGAILSLLRLAYYTLDFALGYWLLVRPCLGRKCMAAIFDRYFFDCLIDPLRFRISLPQRVIRAFSILVPKPDVVILLSAEPEVIYERKPELPVSEIHRQASEMAGFAKYMGNSVWIDSSGPLEDSAREMIRAVLGILEERLV
jgi:thymidylate kinase